MNAQAILRIGLECFSKLRKLPAFIFFNPVLKPFVLWCLGLLACLMQGGCITSTVYWSADGNRGVFVNSNAATLIDADGLVISQLRAGGRYVCWQGDTAYLARQSDSAASGFAIRWENSRRWFGMQWPFYAMGVAPGSHPTDIIRWNADGSQQRIFSIDYPVHHLSISEDGQWIAVLAVEQAKDSNTFSLWVWHQPTGVLFLLDDDCGLPMSFTTGNRLVYMNGSGPHFAQEPRVGALVEVELRAAWQLPMLNHLVYLPADTVWMQNIGEDLLFTTHQRNLPGVSMTPTSSEIYQLFYYARGDRALTVIGENVGKYFSVSPDRQRILYELIEPTREGRPDRRKIAIMQTNGAGQVILGEWKEDDMHPNWHGNDEITWVGDSPVGPAKDLNKSTYDLINYRIDGNRLTPVKNLSQHWDNSIKPALPTTATAPATTTNAATQR